MITKLSEGLENKYTEEFGPINSSRIIAMATRAGDSGFKRRVRKGLEHGVVGALIGGATGVAAGGSKGTPALLAYIGGMLAATRGVQTGTNNYLKDNGILQKKVFLGKRI